MTRSHSSSVMLVSMRSRRMPALLTTTSRPPNVSMAWSIISLAAAKSLTSEPFTAASPPIAMISSTTSWAGPASAPVPSRVGAEVVHDHLGALLGQHQRVLAPDPPAGPGDDGHAPFAHSCHDSLLLLSRTGGVCLKPGAPIRAGPDDRDPNPGLGSRRAARWGRRALPRRVAVPRPEAPRHLHGDRRDRVVGLRHRPHRVRVRAHRLDDMDRARHRVALGPRAPAGQLRRRARGSLRAHPRDHRLRPPPVLHDDGHRVRGGHGRPALDAPGLLRR